MTSVETTGFRYGGADALASGLLSGRELEVLAHLAQRRSTARTAAALGISVNTVRTHVRTLMRKLAVDDRGELVRRARELRIL